MMGNVIFYDIRHVNSSQLYCHCFDSLKCLTRMTVHAVCSADRVNLAGTYQYVDRGDKFQREPYCVKFRSRQGGRPGCCFSFTAWQIFSTPLIKRRCSRNSFKFEDESYLANTISPETVDGDRNLRRFETVPFLTPTTVEEKEIKESVDSCTNSI